MKKQVLSDLVFRLPCPLNFLLEYLIALLTLTVESAQVHSIPH